MKTRFKVSLLIILFIFLSMQGISASIVINEIMPHPTNQYEEWVELYNTQDNDLIFNGIIGDDQGNDTITNLTILSKSFALIVDDNIGCPSFDIPSESCIEVTEIGRYRLNNNGENLSLYDNGSKIDSYNWTSDPGVNVSIGRDPDGGEWLLCDIPSPGASNDCSTQAECDNGICGEDCLDEGQVCCDNISYPGDCCSDDDCSGDDTCESYVCTVQESEPELDEISYNVSLPSKIVSEEEFSIKVEINNNQNKTQGFEVWSYVYIGSKCYSCYWGKTRESNKQNVSLDVRSVKTIELKDKVNASEGVYKLKVKILKEGLQAPKEFTYDVNVTGKTIELENIKETTKTDSEEPKEETETTNAGTTGKATESANNAGKKVVYQSKNEKVKDLAIFLLLGLLVLLVIYIVRNQKA